jgi:hypothetical protein
VAGHKVDIGKITDVAVKTVEGEKDDISAPGQCVAALDLLTGLPDSKKASHVEPGAGHYGIFAGQAGATTSGRWCWTSSTLGHPLRRSTRQGRPSARAWPEPQPPQP